MGSKNELKEIDTKNRTCYYIDFRDILYKNILICDNIMGLQSFRIGFDEIDGLIKSYNGIRYLVLFGHLWYDEIYDSIGYKSKVLVIMKKGFKNSIDHNFARITIDSYSSLPIEKILTFHNVIILIKSTVNNNENYYYNIFLEIRFAKR